MTLIWWQWDKPDRSKDANPWARTRFTYFPHVPLHRCPIWIQLLVKTDDNWMRMGWGFWVILNHLSLFVMLISVSWFVFSSLNGLSIFICLYSSASHNFFNCNHGLGLKSQVSEDMHVRYVIKSFHVEIYERNWALQPPPRLLQFQLLYGFQTPDRSRSNPAGSRKDSSKLSNT